MAINDWSRRSFVSALGWSALGAAAATPAWASAAGMAKHAGRGGSVLVLGAGLAGLAAALELTDAGHEVTLLEARARLLLLLATAANHALGCADARVRDDVPAFTLSAPSPHMNLIQQQASGSVEFERSPEHASRGAVVRHRVRPDTGYRASSALHRQGQGQGMPPS